MGTLSDWVSKEQVYARNKENNMFGPLGRSIALYVLQVVLATTILLGLRSTDLVLVKAELLGAMCALGLMILVVIKSKVEGD